MKARDWLGIVLAIGICTALNVIVFAVLYDAIVSAQSGLSENATQVLTGWGGGIIGILGAMVGYKAGHDTNPPAPPTERPDDPPAS